MSRSSAALVRMTIVVGLLAMPAATDAFAQPPAQSFTALSPPLKVGEWIHVTDVDGAVRSGQLVSLDGGLLDIDGSEHQRSLIKRFFLVESPRQRYVLPERSVRRIQIDDPVWNGRLIGGGAGVALAVAMCTIPGNDPETDDLACVAGAILWPLLGWQFGEMIDASIRKTIYDAPRRIAVSIAPVVTPARVGVRASIRFGSPWSR